MSKLLIKIIRFYQKFISPFLKPSCKFEQSCSQYAIYALQYHGASKGSWMTIKRILKCHPYTKINDEKITMHKSHDNNILSSN